MPIKKLLASKTKHTKIAALKIEFYIFLNYSYNTVGLSFLFNLEATVIQ